MRTWKLCASLLVLAGLAVAESRAAVVLNPQGNGSAAVVFEGPATFVNPSVFQSTLADTMIEKTFTGPGNLVFDNVTFATSDLDFAGGFRWTERIHNDTHAAWTSFTLTLDETTGIFFSDLPIFSPSLVTINQGSAINSAGPNTITKLDSSAGSIALSSDRKSMTITFANPINPEQYFDLHAPIEGLGATTSFELTQGPAGVVVPLPATAWTTLGLLGAMAVVRRFRR